MRTKHPSVKLQFYSVDARAFSYLLIGTDISNRSEKQPCSLKNHHTVWPAVVVQQRQAGKEKVATNEEKMQMRQRAGEMGGRGGRKGQKERDFLSVFKCQRLLQLFCPPVVFSLCPTRCWGLNSIRHPIQPRRQPPPPPPHPAPTF